MQAVTMGEVEGVPEGYSLAFFVADVVFDVEEEEAAGAENAEGFGPGAVVEAAVGAAPLEGAAVVGVEGGAVLVDIGVAAAGVGGGLCGGTILLGRRFRW